MSHTKNYLDQVIEIANSLDCVEIERMVNIIADVRNRGGRLFFLELVVARLIAAMQ